MREYETTFIVQPEISDEGTQEILGRVDAALERASATRLLHDDHGKRKLAYPIQHFQKGRYVTTRYLDGGGAVKPLERQLGYEDSVLRFLTVQVSAEVEDLEARKAAAAEEERIRAERARERAAREAEEERARQEARRQQQEAQEAEEERAREAAEAAGEAQAEEGAEAASEGETGEAAAESETHRVAEGETA